MPRSKSRILFIAVSALLALSIFFSYLLSLGGDNGQGIVLPGESEPASVVTASDSFSDEDIFAEIDTDNVQEVISTIKRPDSYHRSMNVTTVYESGTGTMTVEVWESGENTKIVTSGIGRTKSVLISGDTVYTWYDNEVLTLEMTEDFSPDDFQIIPTYEDVLSLDPEKILSAGYVELDGDAVCVYVEFTGEFENCVERYWISLETGLLVRAVSLEDEKVTYMMEDDQTDVLAATDEIFSEAFKTP